jgi:hypothetical protein
MMYEHTSEIPPSPAGNLLGAILELDHQKKLERSEMSKRVTTTTFRSRGRLTGLVRDEHPAGTGQNRTSKSANRESALSGAEEALFYRARLVLGESLPRPQR